MSNTTYYLDINSNFRNVEEYPISSDFAISFKTNTSTGYFIEGESLNVENMFEQCSIDPDFYTSNIVIKNGQVDNIKLLENSIFICGNMLAGQSVSFNYTNTGIVSIPAVNSNSIFLIRFDILSNNPIPYEFNWCIYTNCKTGPSRTTRSSFIFDLSNNIYFMFDTTAATNDMFLITKNTQPTVFNSIINNTTPIFYDKFHYILPVKELIILYLTSNGVSAQYNNVNWGYHKISSNYGIDKTLDNGRFGLNIDQGNNLILNFNTTYADPNMGVNNGLSLYGYYDYITDYIVGGGLRVVNITRNNFSSIIFNTGYSNKNFYITNVWTNYIFAFGTFPTSAVAFSENLQTGTNKLFEIALPIYNTGTTQPVINEFFIVNNELYSIYTQASTSPNNIQLKILGYNYTGQYINTLATSTNGVGNYTYTTSSLLSSTGTDIYTFLRTTDGSSGYTGGEMQAYKFDTITNNLNFLSTGPRPINSNLINCISQCYVRNGIFYIVVCEITTTFYGSNTPQLGFIYSFDPNTNIITLLSQINLLDDTAQCLVIEQRGSNDYLYITYTLSNRLHIIDITNPSTPIVASSLNIIATQTRIYIRKIDNHYYAIVVYPSATYVNVDDVYNPIFIVNYFGQLPLLCIDDNNYAYILRFNGQAGLREDIEKTKLLNDTFIYSNHYNQNTSKVINLLGTLYNFNTIQIENFTYLFSASSTKLYIYNVTSIESSSLVSELNISLSVSPTYILLTYNSNNKLYISFQLTNSIRIYYIDLLLGFNNINLLQTISTPYNIVKLVNDNNTNIIAVLPYDFIIYKFNNTEYELNTSVNIFSSTGPNFTVNGSFNNYTDLNINTVLIQTYYPIEGRRTYFYNINDINNVALYNISVAANATTNTFINAQDLFTTNSNNVIVAARLEQNFPTDTLTRITNFTTPIGNGISLGGAEIYFTQTGGSRCISGIANTFYDSIIIANSLPSFSFTGGYEFLNIYSTNGVSFTNLTSNTIKLPGITNWLKVINSNNKFISIVLCDNNKLFLYDITNVNSAINFQTLTSVNTEYVLNPSLGTSVIHQLLKDGSPNWINTLGTTLNQSTYFGVNINISNTIIDKSYQYIYTCGDFINQIQLYNYSSTGLILKNEINNSIRSTNGFISKCTIDGNWVWILPINGNLKDSIQRMQYINELNQFSVVGYTDSDSVFILEKQLSNTFTQPSLIQKIINNTSITSSYILTFNTEGILQWNSIIYTTEQFRNVQFYDITITSDKLISIGVSNANTLQYSDSSTNTNNQILYSNIRYTEQSNCVFYIYSLSGTYIQSNLIELPPNTTINIQDIKVEENLNRIIVFPNLQSSTVNPKLNIFNKDGTLGNVLNVTTNIRNTPVIQYLLDSSYTDTDGIVYSQLVYKNNPFYDFYYNSLQNYNVFLFGNFEDPEINKNYSIRKNYFNSNSGATLLLNTVIDTSNLVRQLNYINGLTGSNNYYGMHVSKSPLASIINYTTGSINFTNNTITSTGYYSSLDTTSQYYFSIPYLSSTGYINKIIKINSININNIGQYIFSLDNVNDLRTSESGSFYNPFLAIFNENQSVFYNIQFFPGSIFQPQYYNINVLSLSLPNRPLLNLDSLGGVRYLEDLPFIYLSIYNVDDEDNYDPDIVNVVYDNTPLVDVKPYPLFLIPVYAQGTDSNFVTYSSDLTAIIKFTASFTNIRLRVLDPDGNPLVFDQSLTKPNDFNFIGGELPQYLTNVYVRIALTKR